MDNVEQILDSVDKMPIDNQEIILDVLTKRLKEKRRNEFIEETIESKEEYKSGNYNSGTSENLFNEVGI